MSNNGARLNALARRHRGAVSRAGLRDLGIPLSTLDDRVRRDQLTRPHRSVILMPGATPDPLTATHCAWLAVDDSTVARASAAWLHGLLDRPPRRPTLLIDAARRRPSDRRIDVRRTRNLRPRHICVRDGIPTTNVARTLADLAAEWDGDRLEALLLSALQRRLVRVSELWAVLADVHTAAGTADLRRRLRDFEAVPADSMLEREARNILVAHGLRPWPGPYELRIDEHLTFMLDLAFPDHRCAVECDGKAFHSDPAAFERDRVRWSKIQVTGWALQIVTARRLRTDPGGFVADVREMLAGRGAAPQR